MSNQCVARVRSGLAGMRHLRRGRADDRGTVVRTLIGGRPRPPIADAIEQVLAGAAEEGP
jgi:hypothetical protein